MTTYGTVYDFSATRLTDLPGAVGAMLYVGTPASAKNATPAQVAALLSKGFQLGAVVEHNTTDWASGRANGAAMARAADEDVRRLGLPGVPIAFTADDPAADGARFCDFLRGAVDVLGVDRVSAYGFVAPLSAAHAAGVASRFWLCGHCPSPMPDWVDLYQHNGSQPPDWGPATATVDGIDVDRNTALHPDWGQWHPPTEVDVTPEQDAKLEAVRAALWDPEPAYAGADGAPRPLWAFLQDMARLAQGTNDALWKPEPAYADAKGAARPMYAALEEVLGDTRALASAVTTGVPVTLSDAQMDTLAAKVAALLAAKVELGFTSKGA